MSNGQLPTLENPVRNFVDAQLDYKAGKIDIQTRISIIRAFHAQATDEEKAQVRNELGPLVEAARQRQIAHQAKLRALRAERRKSAPILAPFNALRESTKHSPNLEDVQALVELGTDIQAQIRGAAVIANWEWQDEAYYEGNENATVTNRHGRVIWQGAIPAGMHEFTESASASMRFVEGTPVFSLNFATYQEPSYPEGDSRQLLGAGVGSFRYVEQEDGNYAAEPVVITRQAESFDTLEALFKRLEEVSAEDWSPNTDL